jgi:hypothetical protein
MSEFVCYLREKHTVGLALQKVNSGREMPNRKKKLESEVLVQTQEDGEGDEFRKR